MRPSRDLVALFGLLVSFSVSAIAVATALVIVIGPSPIYPGTPTLVRDPFSTVVEPTDRLVFLGWLLVTGSVAFLGYRVGTRRHRDAPVLGPKALVFLGAVAVIVTAFAVIWFYVPSPDTPALPALTLGVVLTMIVLGSFSANQRLTMLGTLVMTSLAIALFVPTWLQTPSTIRDEYHFPFTVEEIAAPMAGRVPLADFFPQYSTLLGWPIAWVPQVLPIDTGLLSLVWILILQVVAVGAALVLLRSQGDFALFGPRLLIVLGPLTMAQFAWASPLAYFAVIPLRVVLPLLCMALAVLLFSRVRDSLYALIVGFSAGTAMLNNPDFSLGVVAGCLFAVILKTRSRKIVQTLVIYVMSVAAPFLLLDFATRVSGLSIDWTEFLSSQLVFAQDGYMAEIMRPFGLHLLVVSLFVACIALGFVGCWVWSESRKLLLPVALIGVWGLFCMPYFVNRSLPGTLLLGLMLPFSLAVAALLPFVKAVWIALIQDKLINTITIMSSAVVILALVGVLSLWALAPNPSLRIGVLSQSRLSPNADVAATRSSLEELQDSISREFSDPVRIAHAVKFSNLSSRPGLSSISVVSDPHNFSISPFFVRKQCQEVSRSLPDVFILEASNLKWFSQEATCDPLFSSYATQEADSTDGWHMFVRTGVGKQAR